MKVKIRETNQHKGIIGYLHQVVNSSVKIKEYFGIRGNYTIQESEADDFCKLTYGVSWEYNAELGMCVDTELDDINKDLDVDKEDEKLVLTCDYLQAVPNRDPAKMGLTRPPATGRDGSVADSSVYNTPGQGTSGGPSGQQFRGNLQSVSQQTHTAIGVDPAAAKPEGVWKTDITEPEDVYPKESKKRKIKLKI